MLRINFKNFLIASCAILILISIPIKCDAECATPFDCVLKAMEMIKRDRQEMYNMRDQMNDLISSVDKKINDKIGEIKTEINEKLNNITEGVQKEIENLKTNINNDFSKIKEEFNQMKNSTQTKNHMYTEAIVYDNIIDAYETGIISKSGNPIGWDDLTYRKNSWNSKLMINIGSNSQANESGLKVTIPENYDVLWLRVHNNNDMWNILRVMYVDGNKESLPKFAAGARGLNEISPDGGASDSYDNFHMWVPIPLIRSGIIVIHSDYTDGHWISGIAFGKNLWGHAKNSGMAYHWAINSGSKIIFNSKNWNNDILVNIPHGVISELIVPVVANGKDKLLYLVEHNNNWNGLMHTSVSVNGVQIERLRTSYSNPFAVHYNSKLYDRYAAAKIPKDLIKNGDTVISVKIDMTFQNQDLNIREVGTHDLI